MLAGASGELTRFAFKVVLRVARIMRAPFLVDANFAHIDACHYAGQAHLDFAKTLQQGRARFSIPVWTNTLPISLMQPNSRPGANPQFIQGAEELARIYRELGCRPVWTCAPYQLTGGPGRGDNIIVSESNAVTYYNSVVGARTNKYGDFLDVCCALTGRVPYAGLHTDEGRRGEIEFDVSTLSDIFRQSEEFCHVLGYLIGLKAGTKVPVITGLPASTHKDSLKAIGAAAGASGNVTMFHAVGITPEAPDAESAFQGGKPHSRIVVTREMLEKSRAELSPVSQGLIQMVALGTPHFSLSEFERLASLIKGRRINPDVKFYISTSRFVAGIARAKGYIDSIENAGAEILLDTCTYFSPAVKGCRGRVMTNSAKWAFYSQSTLPIEVCFGSLEDCVTSGISGNISRTADSTWAQ